MNNFKLAVIDDHTLLRKGLVELLQGKGMEYKVILEASDGAELLEKLNPQNLPDVILLDINMPNLDGYRTAASLKIQYPELHILALSMYDDESAIIGMLRSGARGYILKDSEPAELKRAIESIAKTGVHYSEMVSGTLIHSLLSTHSGSANNKDILGLNEKEKEFLRLCCSEMTYKEIAEKMYLSPRTIDGYREQLFGKLQVKNRVGLVLFAIKSNIFLLR